MNDHSDFIQLIAANQGIILRSATRIVKTRVSARILHRNYYSEDLVKHAGALFWVIQLVVVSLFLIVSIFLYKNVTFENLHKKWVRKWMESLGGKTLSQAIQQLKELEEFESDKN